MGSAILWGLFYTRYLGSMRLLYSREISAMQLFTMGVFICSSVQELCLVCAKMLTTKKEASTEMQFTGTTHQVMHTEIYDNSYNK